MKRRDLLTNGIIASLGGIALKDKLSFSKSLTTSDNGSATFILSHGDLRKDDMGATSVTSYSAPQNLKVRIQTIKDYHNYHSELKYSSTDKFKIPVFKDILDWMLTNEDFTMNVGINNVGSSQFADLTPQEFSAARLSFIADTQATINSSIYVKAESPFGPSSYFVNSITNQYSSSILAVNAKHDPLIQATSLISGVIFGTIKGQALNATKTQISNYLLEKLGVPSLTQGSYANGKLIIKYT